MIQKILVSHFSRATNLGRATIACFALLTAIWGSLFAGRPLSVLQAAPLTITSPQTISSSATYDGGSWSSGNLTINSGITATLDGGDIFTYTAPSGTQLTGGGTLSNEGDFNYNASGYLNVNNNTKFDNTTTGILNLNGTNSRFYLQTNGIFRNLGGLINANGMGGLIDANGLFTTYDGSTLHSLNLNVAASSSFAVTASQAGGQVQLGNVTVAAGSSATFNTPAIYTDASGGGTGDINFNQAGTINLGNFGMGTNVVLDAGGQKFIGGTIDANGNNMTLMAGRTLAMIGNATHFVDGGTFVNDGTIDMSFTSGQYWGMTFGSTFENNNVLNMNGPVSRIYTSGGTHGTINNFGGTINVNTPGALIDGGGLFTTYDGSTLHDLNLNILSGDFRLIAGGAGGQISLNLPSVPSGSFVTFSTPAVYTNAGGGDLNFNYAGAVNLGSFGMGTNVILDSAENHKFLSGTIDSNGNNMTLMAGRTLEVSGNATHFVDGGTFVNNGTIDMSFNLGQYLGVTFGSTFENNSVLNMNGPVSRIYTSGGTHGTINNFGGTINVNTPGALIDGGGLFTTYDGSTLHDLNLNINSGNFTLVAGGVGGQISLNLPAVPSGSFVTFSTPAVYTNAGGGDLNFNYAGAVNLGSFGMGTNVILDSAENHKFLGGTIPNNGFDMTLETGRSLIMQGNATIFNGAGKFYNKGDVTQTTNLGQYLGLGGSEFVNTGSFTMDSESARIYQGGGGNFNNQGGTLTKNSATTLAYIDGGGTFKNTGTVFVPGGEMELRTGTSLLSYSAGTLTEGTWIVDSTATGTAMLDLQPANAGINIIGTNADVQLIGTGANLVQLGSDLSGLDGKLKLSEGKQFSVDFFSMGSAAELTLGLGSLAATNSQLNVNGDLTANGLINIEDLGGLEIGVYDLIIFDGAFTDNGIALGDLPSLFNSPGFTANLIVPDSGVIGGVIQLNVGYVPEPGTSTLLGLGLLGLMNFRRRKQHGKKA